MFSPDEGLMRRAIELAARARHLTRPNPCVGAVIVGANGALLAEGFHRKAGMPHAEAEALATARAAGHDVRGATMYVTLEPCTHVGRTPPCADALIKAGIARVVIGARDPNPQAGGGVERLRAAGLEVHAGFLERECFLLNPGFHVYHSSGRPLVTLKWAITLDGCTSVASGDSKWITGGEARAEVHRRRACHDVVLAGIGTVLIDGARLTVRLPGDVYAGVVPPGFRHTRIVLDTSLRLPPDSPFLEDKDTGSRVLVACAADADESRARALVDRGAEILRLDRGPGGVSIPALLSALHARRIQSVYVEGGRTVAGRFIEAGAVDCVEAWMGSVIAGGGPRHLGPIVCSQPPALMADAPRITALSTRVFGGDLLVEGWVEGRLPFPPLQSPPEQPS